MNVLLVSNTNRGHTGRETGAPKPVIQGRHRHGPGCLHNGRWSEHVSVTLWVLTLADRCGPGLLRGLLGEICTWIRHSDKRTHTASSIRECRITREPRRYCGHSEMPNSQRCKIHRSCSMGCHQTALMWQCHQFAGSQVWAPCWALTPTPSFTHRHAHTHMHTRPNQWKNLCWTLSWEIPLFTERDTEA